MSAMTLIEHIELTDGSATSIVLDAIPQDYTDLLILVSTRHTANVIDGRYLINGAGGNRRALYGTGSGSGAGSTASFQAVFGNRSGTTANTFANSSIYIPNYTAAQSHLSIADTVEENNATQAFAGLNANSSTSTAAVTSVTIQSTSGDLAQYSSATIYGITAGSDGSTTVS